jgi:hypothetical protein
LIENYQPSLWIIAALMIVFAGMLLNKLDCSTLMLDGQLFHMRCCAHILNLIAQDGLSVIGGGIEKVRDSVSFWTATPKREVGFDSFVNETDDIQSKSELDMYLEEKV